MCTYAYFYIMYIKKFSFQDVSLVLFHSIVEMLTNPKLLREHVRGYVERGMRVEEWYLDIGEYGPKEIYVCPEKVDRRVVAAGKGTTRSEN